MFYNLFIAMIKFLKNTIIYYFLIYNYYSSLFFFITRVSRFLELIKTNNKGFKLTTKTFL